MKKLMLLGIVGSMFVIGQSLVFANGTGSEKLMEFTKSIAAVEKSVEESNIENEDVVVVSNTVASTEAEAPTTEEKAAEITSMAEAINE